jgi:ribosome-associated toxin RatA of RatAB toxin-antitoxin module
MSVHARWAVLGSIWMARGVWASSELSLKADWSPDRLRPVIEERTIEVHANLKALSPAVEEPQSLYQIRASMRVSASVSQVYQALTNYRLYPQLVPFVQSATYTPLEQGKNRKGGLLHLVGGIWNYRLTSGVFFSEDPEVQVDFEIQEGHFTGMAGKMQFESLGEKGTLVFFQGSLKGSNWPPRWVIEQGAEIVFGFTAQKMRSYIESIKNQNGIQGGIQNASENKIQKTTSGPKQENGVVSSESFPRPRSGRFPFWK